MVSRNVMLPDQTPPSQAGYICPICNKFEVTPPSYKEVKVGAVKLGHMPTCDMGHKMLKTSDQPGNTVGAFLRGVGMGALAFGLVFCSYALLPNYGANGLVAFILLALYLSGIGVTLSVTSYYDAKPQPLKSIATRRRWLIRGAVFFWIALFIAANFNGFVTWRADGGFGGGSP
jgi:hypothetical protein